MFEGLSIHTHTHTRLCNEGHMEKQVLTYVLHACIPCLVKETPSSKEPPSPYFWPNFLFSVSPAWSELHVATGVQLRSTASLKHYAYLSFVLQGSFVLMDVAYVACTVSYTRLSVTWVTWCRSECCLPSGLDFGAAGGSVVCYCLSNYLLWGHRVAVNMTRALFRVLSAETLKRVSTLDL